jgi:hypothetical protein
MPLERQPKGARGTVEHPDSALRLRQVLAIFGLVVCVAGGVLMQRIGATPIAIILYVLAATAVVDLIVVTLRLRRPT